MFNGSLRGLAFVLCVGLLPPASAATLSANFDSLSSSSGVTAPYAEGGIQFTSPSEFAVATGYQGAAYFGGGGYSYVGNSLYVHNTGWVGIRAPGSLMSGVSFLYGFDWNFYAIENGLMDTTFEWQMWLGGSLVSSGATLFDYKNRSHGNLPVTIGDGSLFDQLLVRSTAIEYKGIYTGGTGPSGFLYERGEIVGWGDQNHIAFDNVSVQVAVPDYGPGITVVALTCLGIAFVARRRRRLQSQPTKE